MLLDFFEKLKIFMNWKAIIFNYPFYNIGLDRRILPFTSSFHFVNLLMVDHDCHFFLEAWIYLSLSYYIDSLRKTVRWMLFLWRKWFWATFHFGLNIYWLIFNDVCCRYWVWIYFLCFLLELLEIKGFFLLIRS